MTDTLRSKKVCYVGQLQDDAYFKLLEALTETYEPIKVKELDKVVVRNNASQTCVEDYRHVY